jgi:hypothetical protein
MTKFEFFNKLNYDIEYYYATEGEYPIKIYMSPKFIELLIFLNSQNSLDNYLKTNNITEIKYHDIPVEIDYSKKEYYFCLISNEFEINEIE